jgi:hypothetical protein
MTQAFPKNPVRVADISKAPQRVLVPVYDMTANATVWHEADRDKILALKWGPKEIYIDAPSV